MTRVTATGAGGFTGHHLVNYLKERGYCVRGAYIKEPEFESSRADKFQMLDPSFWENCFRATFGVDQAYTLGADMGGMGFVSANNALIHFNNAPTNFHVLEAARQNGVSQYPYTCLPSASIPSTSKPTVYSHAS